MRVFCHVDVLWNRYFDSLIPMQVMNHWTLSSAHPFGRKAHRENLTQLFARWEALEALKAAAEQG